MRAATGDGPGAWAPDVDRSAYPTTDFGSLEDHEGTVLDVRRPDEREDGALDGSVHIPLDELLDRLDDLPDDTLLVHCASGFRASIAASLLDRAGRDVVLVDDSFENAGVD